MKKLSKQAKTYIIVVGIFTVISGFLFQKLLLGDYTFTGPDSMSPAAIKTGIELATEENGEYPLWLPWVFSGLPSVHSFQNISHFYLPNYVIDFLKMLGMPAFWNYIFYFVFAGMGCFVLLRKLKTDVFSAILGGVAFLMTPYLTTMVVHGHGSQMMTSAYIPWIIWSIVRLKEQPNLQNMGLLSILAGLQLQRAHVQIAYYTWLMVGLFIVIEFIQYLRTKEVNRLQTIGYSFGGLVLGIGIALSIYLPAMSYTPYSIRGAISTGGGAGIDYATQWSFSFGEMITFIIPSFYGFGGASYWGNMPFTDYPNYMGILVLVLAIISIVKCKGTIRIFLVLTIAIALMLSFGKNFFLYSLFYEFLPFFKKFRVPVMFLILVQFSIAILSGLGLNYIRENIDKYTKYSSYILSTAVGISIVLLLAGSTIVKTIQIPQTQYQVINKLRTDIIAQDTFTMMLLLIAFSILLFVVARKFISIKVFLGSIIALSIVDLSIIDTKIIEPSKNSFRSSTLNSSAHVKRYLREDDVIKFLKKDTTDFRIFPVGELANENRWSAFNLESIMGYHPAKLNNYELLKSEVGFNSIGILQMLNVKYLVSVEPINHPSFSKAFEGNLYHNGNYKRGFVYQLNTVLPRVFFANKIRSSSNAKQYEILKHPQFQPTQHSFVTASIEELELNTDKAQATLIKKTPDHIVVETESETEQFLIFSEIYYPKGWEATIDGNSTKIYEVNSVLRGIFVPAGEHEVKMDFAPKDILIGKLISFLSIVLSLVLIFIHNLRRRKQ